MLKVTLVCQKNQAEKPATTWSARKRQTGLFLWLARKHGNGTSPPVSFSSGTERAAQVKTEPGGSPTMHHKNNTKADDSRMFQALLTCLGFGQDRVNFDQNPGRGTAGQADPTPTWPNRAGYSIPCAVRLGSSGGELGSGNSLVARELAAAVVEGGPLGRAVCVVFSPYLYHRCYCSLCLLFC